MSSTLGSVAVPSCTPSPRSPNQAETIGLKISGESYESQHVERSATCNALGLTLDSGLVTASVSVTSD